MIVNKTCVLNSVEPSPLSFRAPMGLDIKLNVTFYGQDGQPYSSDLGAQLQLTGRSTARTRTYFMLATDIANGRARATIPGGDISDVNGYRLRLLGTWNGEPALLALGTLATVAAAGLETVPEDVIDTVDLVLTRGQIAQVGVKLWDDAGGSDPFDLADEGTTVTSSIYENRGGAVLVPFAVTVVASNEVLLTLTASQVDVLPDLCWWSLVASNASGANTLCEGSVTVKNPPAGSGDFMISLYYIATAGQTVFPVTTPDRFGNIGEFTAASIPHVSRSGVRISPTDGFTAVGNTVTLINPAGAGEQITIDIWEPA